MSTEEANIHLNASKDEPVKIQVSELSPFLAAIASVNEQPWWEMNVSKVSSRDETSSVPFPSGVVETTFQEQLHDFVADFVAAMPLEFEASGQWPETWWVPQSSFEDSWITDWITGQSGHMMNYWPGHWENEWQTELASYESSPPPAPPPSPCSQTLVSSPPSFSKLSADCVSMESSSESTNAEETVSGNTSEDDGCSDGSDRPASMVSKTSQEPESKETGKDDWSTFGAESMECWDYDFMLRDPILPPGLCSPRPITPPPGLSSPGTISSDADVSETDVSPCSSAIEPEAVVIPLRLSSYRKGNNSRQQRTPGCTKKKKVRSEPLQSRTRMQVEAVTSSPKQATAAEVSMTKSNTSCNSSEFAWRYVLLAVGLLIVAVVAILFARSQRLDEERAYEALLDNVFPSIAVAPAESLDIEFAMGRADKVSRMKSKFRVLSKSILSFVIKGWA